MSTTFDIAVIGSGTMGAGIAQVCAQAGMTVLLYDISASALERAVSEITKNYTVAIVKGKMTELEKTVALNNIQYSSIFDDLVADLCIEAIVEKLEVKRDLMHRLALQNNANCILASNTSSIPITQIAAKVEHPERVIGIHFFNPAHLMKLVEIIAGVETSETVIDAAKTFVNKLNKTAVIARDAPGFIVNRVARHYYVEGLKILEEQSADMKSIDLLMEATGFKMGPFKLMDLIGVDTNFSVTSSLYEQFFYDPKFRPNRIQKQKVDAGHWGKKTGRGFYSYE